MKPSKIIYGCQLLGSQIDANCAGQVLDFCFENGISKFDLAEEYPFPEKEDTVGESERIFEMVKKNASKRNNCHH